MLQRELSAEDIARPNSENLKRSQSSPTSDDVKRVRRTSVEHNTQSTITDQSEAPASVSSLSRDVVDGVDGSCRSDTSQNNVSQSTSVGSSANQPVSASAGSSQTNEPASSTTNVLKPMKESSLLLAAQVVLSSQPINQSSEPSQEHKPGPDVPSSVTTSQDSMKVSSSDLIEPRASSLDEIEASLQCIICQEILYKCVRSVPCRSVVFPVSVR